MQERYSAGPIWGDFPSAAQWDALAPRGTVRNLKGREAAVAYRDRAAEPYHYSVMSYDERGRVEALLRYTENLGFDAVYYRYNSMNQVIAITSADYLRQHTTWYGYDDNGRVDSVWTSLGSVNNGLYSFLGFRYPAPLARPGNADILYYYNRTRMMDSLIYPAIQTSIRYAYNNRKWVDSITAKQKVPGFPDALVFNQRLTYDATGQILKQRWQHGNNAIVHHNYLYDATQRLTDWNDGTIQTEYQYDPAGNRVESTNNGFQYDTDWNYHSGTNGIESRITYDQNGGARSNFFEYNPNGSVRQREHWFFPNGNGEPESAEQFAYGYRELPHRMQTYTRQPGGWNYNLFAKEDWRYRYNPMGEREQKRMYKDGEEGAVPVPDDGKVYPWVYYLLGGSREQLAVYHGQQVKNPFCGDTGMRVYMYPVEYLSRGAGGGVVLATYPNGRRKYYVSDHLGSVRVILDSIGSIADSYNYDVFGDAQIVSGTEGRQGYIGKERDKESGLGSYGVRGYSSDDGNFLSVDPLFEALPSVSPYHYALNSPMSLKDPSGAFFTFANEDSKNTYNKMYQSADAATRAKYDALQNSRVEYRLNIGGSLLDNRVNAMTYYDFKNDIVQIVVKQGLNNPIGSIGDELEACYQFETGQVGYNIYGQMIGYDMDDEIETKNAGVQATNAYNALYNTGYQHEPQIQRFLQAQSNGAQALIQYFKGTPYQFHPQADTPGRKMSANFGLNGSPGLTPQQLDQQVVSGKLPGYVVRILDALTGQYITHKNPR